MATSKGLSGHQIGALMSVCWGSIETFSVLSGSVWNFWGRDIVQRLCFGALEGNFQVKARFWRLLATEKSLEHKRNTHL